MTKRMESEIRDSKHGVRDWGKRERD